MLRIKADKLIIFQIIYCLIIIPWLSYFGVSNIKVIVSDVVNLMLLLPLLHNKTMFRSRIRYVYSTYLWVILFAATVVVSFFVVNLIPANLVQSAVLAIWNFRILFRPFLFMVLCVFYLNKKVVHSMFELFYKLQFVNIVLTLFQYYVQGYWMDRNGGIFAPLQGCNKYSNVFCLVITAWVLLEYLNRKVKLHKLVVTFAHLFIVAIYAELKILFVEVIILVAISVLLSGKGSRKIAMLCYGTIASVIGLVTLASIFPSSFQFLADIESFMWYAKDMSYSNTEVSVNRLSGFEIINNYMFQDSILHKLFGFGVGMTGSIPFAGIYSNISLKYSTLFYQVFTYSWIFADNGYVGILLYFITLLSIFLSIQKIRKFHFDSNFLIFSQVLSILTAFLAFYDASWVTEGTTFLLAFGLSIGFVAYKESTASIP